MKGFTTTSTLAETINKRPIRKREMSRKRKRKSVPKDKKTGVPKKYLSGLKGSKRMTRARLIKQVASIYKSGGFIPRDLLKRRTRS